MSNKDDETRANRSSGQANTDGIQKRELFVKINDVERIVNKFYDNVCRAKEKMVKELLDLSIEIDTGKSISDISVDDTSKDDNTCRKKKGSLRGGHKNSKPKIESNVQSVGKGKQNNQGTSKASSSKSSGASKETDRGKTKQEVRTVDSNTETSDPSKTSDGKPQSKKLAELEETGELEDVKAVIASIGREIAKKTGTSGRKDSRAVGEHEKRLLERQQRSQKRRALRIERRLARGFDKFARLVSEAFKEFAGPLANQEQHDRSTHPPRDLGFSESYYSESSSWSSCSCSTSDCSCTFSESDDSTVTTTSSSSEND